MLDLKDKKIALLKGGPGSERKVSLKTAESVAEALKTLGAQVIEIDVDGPDFEVPSDVFVVRSCIDRAPQCYARHRGRHAGH